MAALSKRMRLIKDKIGGRQVYSCKEAIELLKDLPPSKFVQSVEANIHLNINPKKSDQVVRDVVILPHGTGRQLRVIVLAQDKPQVEAVIAAGAARAGGEELINEIKQGELKLNERDILIATPSVMRFLVPLGPLLGPKGLMPNPKLGTVTDDLVTAVREALLGRVQYRSDKGGVVRCLTGKLSLSAESLQENFQTLLMNLVKNKPASAPKGKTFIKKIALSSTMGPELWIDQSSLEFSKVL